MSVIEICRDKKNTPRNTGTSGEQCLEGVLEKPAVAKTGFRFASVADFKSREKWAEAIANKNIVPLYDTYEVTPENTEATTYESGKFSYKTSEEVKKTSFECYLGFCAHRALKSYSKSEYTQIFEFTADGSVWGVETADGKVKGQDLTNFNVGIRTIPTKDKPANTKVTLTYRDYNELEDNPVGVIPDFDVADLNGIYDVTLTQVAATATSIKFRVSAGCAGGEVKTLTGGDIVVKEADGDVKTVTFVPYDEDGDFYEVTGTGFTTGHTVSLDGVITQAEIMYEAEKPMEVTVTP